MGFYKPIPFRDGWLVRYAHFIADSWLLFGFLQVVWLERRDKKKKDSSENNSDHTDEPNLHTGL